MAFWNRNKKQGPDPQSEIEALQNKLEATLQQMQVNAETDQAIRNRLASAISGGYDYADTLHNIYHDFGYPGTLTFYNYWNMFRRFGIAKNVVNLPVDTSWISPPTLEAPDAFNRQVEELDNAVDLWHRLKGLDMRQRVGRYAGLFMRVRDGQWPDKPLESKLPGIGALVDIIPIHEGQLEVLDTDNDPRSETYGKPVMYLYNSGGPGNRNDRENNAFNIHPSRLIIAAEGADDGSIYGISALEACYNSLMDLRKVIGAGGEGFYKNAAQSVVFSLKDTANAVQNEKLLEKFNEQYDDFIKNRARRGLWTPGLEPNVMGSNLIDPKEFFMAALNDVAAASQIPATILIGQQTGRLASTEDSKSFLAAVNSRRENFVTSMVTDVFNWCIRHGILPAAEFEVVWDDLLAMSDTEKLELSKAMATTNREQFLSGGETPFTSREIRVAAGYEIDPEDDMEDDEELDAEVPGGAVPPGAGAGEDEDEEAAGGRS